MRWDLHVHSRYSFDSIASPAAILRRARAKDLAGVAIADHNTIGGALQARRVRRSNDPRVIVGEEIATDAGDLIGLFLEHHVEPGKAARVAREIHEQQGIVILPHPYRGHSPPDDLVRLVDAVEAFNARTAVQDNAKAAKLASLTKKPGIAASDAHFSFHVGRAWIKSSYGDVREVILRGEFRTGQGYTPESMMALSQLIKTVKRRDPIRLPRQVGRMAAAFVRRGDGTDRQERD